MRNQRTILRALSALLLLTALAAPARAWSQNPFANRSNAGRTIASITFFGNNVTKEYILRRELQFEEGDAYDSAVVSDAWERL